MHLPISITSHVPMFNKVKKYKNWPYEPSISFEKLARAKNKRTKEQKWKGKVSEKIFEVRDPYHSSPARKFCNEILSLPKGFEEVYEVD